MTGEELKALLQTPAALFLVMLLGSVASALKQLRDGKVNGAEMTCAQYLAHWPETAGALITNALAFALLIVTDQLNFGSALGIGYVANSASDLLRTGGRSAAIASPKQSGFASIAIMVLLAIGSAIILAGCASTQGKQLDPTGRIALETSVRIAVRHAVEANPRAVEKAEHIRSIVAKVQSLTTAESTVSALETVVRAEVAKLNLSPLDQADADDLITLLGVALQSRFQGPDAIKLIAVNEFLSLVLSALPPAPSTT